MVCPTTRLLPKTLLLRWRTPGDVDILAFGPLTPSFDNEITPDTTVAENIAKLFGATKWITNSPSTNFAIPWPTPKGREEEKFVQLDVHICKSEKGMKWELFHTAHGDLWNILGSTVSNLLTYIQHSAKLAFS
jgi:hypothetical protein